MRKFGLTIAMVAALSAGALGAGTAATPVSAASSPGASGGGSAVARTSGLTPKQKLARKKALRKCKSKRAAKARKACQRRVKRRFTPKPKPPVEVAPPVAVIDVGDDYFSPDLVNIKRGDSILWVWNDLNHDPHNVTLLSSPAGVDRSDFETSSAPAVKFRFTRTFKVPGTYEFACSLHHNMKITVVVS